MAAEHTRLYLEHPVSTARTPCSRFRPSSSAVRYIEQVRMPAEPRVKNRPVTASTSCKRPIPAAPVRLERYT